MKLSKERFFVIGISVRTSNENGLATKDIPALWEKFMSEVIIDKIPNKVSNDIFCLYTDYEKDHTLPYTTILGCEVSSLASIPENMFGKQIDTQNYTQFKTTGNLMEGAVFNEWMKIWNANLPRTYTTDFEIYDEKAKNPENAEVSIFVAVK